MLPGCDSLEALEQLLTPALSGQGASTVTTSHVPMGAALRLLSTAPGQPQVRLSPRSRAGIRHWFDSKTRGILMWTLADDVHTVAGSSHRGSGGV